MLGDLPWYARHVRGTPREHIGIHAEKVDEHGFLFDVESGVDPQHPVIGAGRVDWDEFDGLRGLKSPGSMLGLGQLAAESVKVNDEGLGLHESLDALDACSCVDSIVMTQLGPGILSLR